MDHDDDVEHLFSWLQTPDLRYREFAGAREITDSVVVAQRQRLSNTPVPQDAPEHPPHHDAQLREEYPQDQFPDQGETRVEILPEPRSAVMPEPRAVQREEVRTVVREQAEVRIREDLDKGVVREETRVMVREQAAVSTRGPQMIAPEPMAGEPPPGAAGGADPFALGAAGGADPFALGAAGRGAARPEPMQAAAQRPPLIAPPPTRPAIPATPQPTPLPPPSHAAPQRPSAGGGLLGGAYRQNGTNGPPSETADQATAASGNQTRSLDAVFGRLAGGRARVADPRDRMRHIPGFRPPADRSR